MPVEQSWVIPDLIETKYTFHPFQICLLRAKVSVTDVHVLSNRCTPLTSTCRMASEMAKNKVW